ncbi:LysR family transcriptional regulator [Luteolibacter ambystomatis]|uniref:LysR family transcriptional regulator n=1 Tax=Luteolibacter ambystomatis TaxID=2824561 RepID=A0A975G7I1_9BACT|nr:LysR substrate-binding domain-containing protein [Luteolibacter ambystomatis]QUE50514.1 LysR family transcriptional regulator [Luteolibacter ambystomatis]
MEIRQLELLRTILEEGSLTAAAKRCHLSQPALSQQIQALEAELGEPLLIRKPRGVEATAAGSLLMEHAARILEETARAKDAFTGRRELQSGKVAFGIIPTIAPYLLPRLLGPFRKRFPGIDLAVSEARTADLIPQVVSGAIEFAILSDVAEAERKRWSLHLRELFREPLLLAAPADHPLATRKQSPTAADLDASELIHLQGGHCLSDRTLRVCKIRDPNPGLRCDQLSTAMAMVAAGLGVTVVPKLAVRDLGDSVVIRPFAGEGLYRTVSLMKRRGAKASPAAEELLRLFTGPKE